MKTSKQIDFIIVGQGLAGSALALQLLKRNKKILVIDRIKANSPSRIAVGLFNPITGRHMIKTWMADRLFPYLHQFYQEAEALTQNRFFYPPPFTDLSPPLKNKMNGWQKAPIPSMTVISRIFSQNLPVHAPRILLEGYC